MESDSDYEEPSEDPFEGQFSDSDDSDANITPYKDTRTTQVCRRCGSGCCKTHSRILCSQCFDS